MIQHVLEGALTEADHKAHIPVSFEVPKGTTRLNGTFSSTPERAPGTFFDHMVCLTVWGPDGSRGTRHNNPVRDFAIDAYSATPGFTPGPIEPGVWTVYLDCFRVLGPDPLNWRLEITCEDAPIEAPAPLPAPVRPERGAGWYRGDLHAHTIHSDSTLELPDLAAFARSRGLDFVTLTDHNTISGVPAFEHLADQGLLTMGGIELTTHYGHALTLGTRAWTEWRGNSFPGVTMPGIAASVMEAGHVFVIAHPRAPGDDEGCTGCRWEYKDMMPGNAKVVEIWNGPWADYNEEGLALFHSWLEAGHKLAATSGTDIHGPREKDDKQGFNHVWAESLTEAAVLDAVRAGRNYISSGPRLILSGQTADGKSVPMGGTIGDGTLSIGWSDAEGLALVIVADGVRGGLIDIPEVGARDMGLPRRWLMAELRGSDGRLHAVTNPIFAG
jgi:hypothetical protein